MKSLVFVYALTRSSITLPKLLGKYQTRRAGSISEGKLAAITALRKLSHIDKQILKALLDPDENEKGSSTELAAKMGIPRTTFQHRRDYLEIHYLETSYSLNLDYLGYRRVDLLIYTGGRNTVSIAKKLQGRHEVVYVGRSIGEPTIDLRAEIIIKDNSELLELLETLKAMPNVKYILWSEIVKIVGRKRSVPSSTIDQL